MFYLQKKTFLPLPLFLLFFCILHCHGMITIETTRSTEPIKYDCDKVKFHMETFITCACLDGIWAFLLRNPGQPAQWKVMGGQNQCYQLGQWVSQIRRISKDTTKSTITKLKQNSNKFLVANEGHWETHLVLPYNQTFTNGQRVLEEDSKKKKICLTGGGKNKYCIYALRTTEITPSPSSSSSSSSTPSKTKVEKPEEKTSMTYNNNNNKGRNSKPFFSTNKKQNPAKLWYQIQEKSFTPQCSPDSVKMKPLYCEAFEPDVVDDELFVCSLISNEHRAKRVKRQDPAAPAAPAAGGGGASGPRNTTSLTGPDLDEDFVSPDSEKLYKGDPKMMQSIADYIHLAVAKILEISTGRTKRFAIKKSPVQTLLRLTSDIMKRTCSVVNADTFTIALESFLKLQKDTYHLKEPYIPYSAYTRILAALEKCKEWAQPHMFIPNATLRTEPYCETAAPTRASDQILLRGHNLTLHALPAHALSSPAIHDPIIETVWKSFISSHSYCYKFFKDYYNDHHTFTVAVMPFFTNQMQKLWILGDGNSTGAATANYSTDAIWYGNMLGDTGKLFENIDGCYAAARQVSLDGYPWYLNRPNIDKTNNRKRRSASELDTEDAGENSKMEQTVVGNSLDNNNKQQDPSVHVSYFNEHTGEDAPNTKKNIDINVQEKPEKEVSCDDGI